MANLLFLLIYFVNFLQLLSTLPLPLQEHDVVLSEFIRHYEPAIYDPDAIQRSQRRLRRAATTDWSLQRLDKQVEPLRFNITGMQRVFKLVLYPETNLFAPDVVFETNDNRSLQFDPGKIYHGTLEDDPSALVHGLLTEAGLFDGSVTTSTTRFYIEPTTRYLSGGSRSSPSSMYHTVVYSEDDVIKPPSRRACASEELRRKRETRDLRRTVRDTQDLRRNMPGADKPVRAVRRRKTTTTTPAPEKTYEELIREEQMRRDAEEEVRNEELKRREKHDDLIKEELMRREIEEEARKEELKRREKQEELVKEELKRREQEENVRKESVPTEEKTYEELIKEEQMRREEEEEARNEELKRREKHDDLIKKELMRRELEEEARKEELKRREKQEELVKEELKRREQEEKVRKESVPTEEKTYEELIKEEQMRRDAEEELRNEELKRRESQEYLVKEELERRETEEKLRKEELKRRDDVEKLRIEELLRRQSDKDVRKAEELRREKVEQLRLEELMRRDAEVKLREEEMERRKKVDALQKTAEKTHEDLIEEELLRREKQEELVKEELLKREKEEELRKEELLRREKEEDLVKEELLRREKADELVKEEQLRREKEDEMRRKTSFRPRIRVKGGLQSVRRGEGEEQSVRRGEAEAQNTRQGQGGVQNARQGPGSVQNARRGDALRGDRRKRRVGGDVEPYYLDRTMRDESQDIDTILRVEAPNKTIISISKPGLKNNIMLNGTHRNIITNSRPSATEYDDSLNEFDSFFNRNPKFSIIDSKKTTCMLYLQADHLFYEKYGTEEACIEVMTRHVQRVNAIYKNTDFNQDGVPDNITFMIKRIKVHTQESVASNPTYRYHGNYGVEKFLEIFSEEDYDAFCLAYMFTYRDFEMGTLGLAWTGDLKNAGGVCEKNGHYRGSMKSLNTGIVTLLNYGKHVPPAVSHVTLAHEIGHNFGSPHDPEICTPGGDEGNFIMFARATSGDKKNNNRFSQCSLNSINPVLNSKARNGKGCFIQPQVSLCGNGVVEEGEECDCGWEEDCKDVCCHPQRRYPSPGIKPCTLTPGSACSPSQGPCCTGECRVKRGDKCRDDNGCRDASQCDGRHAQCPPSVNKPNKTVCNAEFVCFMGECTGSICLAYGLESCQCIPSPTDSLTKACELCCKLPGENQPCLSSFLWNTPPYDVPDMYSKPGTPCNDYNGYCDVFQKCREVDPSGPLATLRKLLLSDESINSVKKWALEHWYYSGLMFFSFLLILVLSARLFGKESNRKKSSQVTIIHSSTTETVRLPSDPQSPLGGNVTVHPVVVRSKLPLKKKVRERGKKSRGGGKENTADTTGDPASRKIAKKLIEKNLKKNMKPLAKIGEEDPLGKVRHWLLNSHHISNGLNSLRKSKSSPAGFVPVDTVVMTNGGASDVPAVTTVPAVLPPLPAIEEAVSPAVHASDPAEEMSGNGADLEVKLQVVFKPPFKFSVKLRKPNKVDVKKQPAVTAVTGKKIEKSSSSNRLIEDEPPALSKQKLSKHKLMDKNVPEPIKKRAALLIRADKTLRRLPRGMGHKGKKTPSGKSGKGKKLSSGLNNHGTELARLISQESNNSQRLDQDPSTPLAEPETVEPVYEHMIYQPVYENKEVTSHPPAKDKLDKLSKHSRNVEAAMSKRSSGEMSSPHATDSGERYKRQSSADNGKSSSPGLMGEGKFTAIDPECARYLTNEDLIDMNAEPSRTRPGVDTGQDRKKLQHRSKRKNKQSPTSTTDPRQKLEKRNSMSDVTKLRNYDASTDAPSGKLRRSDADLSRRSITTDLRSSNCDLTAVNGGLSCVPAVPANSKLRHSSSDVMRHRRGSQECLPGQKLNKGSQEYLPSSGALGRTNVHRGSQEYLQSRGYGRGDHLPGSQLSQDKSGRQTRQEFGSQDHLPTSRPSDYEPPSGPPLTKSSSGVKLRHSGRHKTELDSSETRKRHSMSEMPSSGNGNYSSRNEPNVRQSSRNQTKGNPSSKRRNSSQDRDKRHSMSDVPNMTHNRSSGEQVPNRNHDEKRGGGENVPNKTHHGDTTNQMHIYENLLDDSVSTPRIVSSKQKDGQTSPLATVNSHGQTIRRNGSRSSLNTGSSKLGTNTSSNSLNREASQQQPRSSSLTRSSRPSSSKTNTHSTSPHSTSKPHSTNRNSPLSHSASFSSGNNSQGHPSSPMVPDISPVAAASQRTYSSSDLMRFPSVENEANSRLDFLISGGKK